MGRSKSNQKKYDQLGQPFGTATSRLRKLVLFNLLSRYGDNNCYRCKEIITSPDDLSMEHKIPWLDSENPVELFFDLDNIAFSHLSCNYADARRPTEGQTIAEHGTLTMYRRGCRCKDCRGSSSLYYYTNR